MPYDQWNYLVMDNEGNMIRAFNYQDQAQHFIHLRPEFVMITNAKLMIANPKYNDLLKLVGEALL